MKKILTPIAVALCIALTGCVTTESHQSIQTERAQESVTVNRSNSTAKVPVSIGQFANHSTFGTGIFAQQGNDRLGTQAETILATFLQQAGCYQVLDRTNMNALKRESGFNKKSQKIRGARYVITGDVVEFGRKTVGDRQLFGILGHGKEQVAYARVNINIVDVETTEVVYSSTGAGEYALSSREVLGFGSRSGYDATLNGKVLSLAIREAVNDMTRAIDSGAWKPAK